MGWVLGDYMLLVLHADLDYGNLLEVPWRGASRGCLEYLFYGVVGRNMLVIAECPL